MWTRTRSLDVAVVDGSKMTGEEWLVQMGPTYLEVAPWMGRTCRGRARIADYNVPRLVLDTQHWETKSSH